MDIKHGHVNVDTWNHSRSFSQAVQTFMPKERSRITAWVQKYKVHRPFQVNSTTQSDVRLVLAEK